MEAGAFAGAPPEVAEQQPPTQQPEQAQPTEQQPETGQQSGEQNAAPAENDILGRLDALGQKVDALRPAQQEDEPAVDLLTALEGEPDEFGTEQQTVAPEGPEAQQFEDPAAQQQLEDLRSFVRQEAEQIAAPILERERRRELASIEQQYPDITSKPVMDKLRPLMAEMAEEAGTDSVIDNPTFLKMAYRAVKAELADAGAVPAEQAAASGASLETNAGQAQAGGPDSLEDQYRHLVYGNPQKADF